VAGIPLAIASIRVVPILPFGIQSRVPLTFLAALAGISMVTLAASLLSSSGSVRASGGIATP